MARPLLRDTPAPWPAPAGPPPSPFSPSPGSTSPLGGPSPAPAPAATPPSPSPEQCYSPSQVRALYPTDEVCCTGRGVFGDYCVTKCPEEYSSDSPCCKPYGQTVCYAPANLGGVCNSWGICSWVAIILAVVALLLLSVCCVSTMMTRTRRRRRMWDEQLRMQSTRERRGGQGYRGQTGGIGDVELANIISMDEATLAQLAVRKALPLPGQPPRECAICLETRPVDQDVWVAFPCTHSCCQPCFADLLRHNPCIQRQRHLVQCPFCRQVATAIRGPSRQELPGDQQQGAQPPMPPS